MSDDIAKLRERLETRLASLQGRLKEISDTLREPDDEDFEEQAADLDDDELQERLSNAGRTEMRLIQEALRRMDQGTYGACVECGQPIAPRRLEALPEADRCLACAQGATRRR
jgi:RNA polymerase-binding transcription factor DksA